MSLSERFGNDPVANQALWRRDERNPIIATAPWCAEFVAPCSVLENERGLTVFVEGGVSERESIGSYTCGDPCVAGAAWVADDNPILTPAASGFDRGSVFDPAVIAFGGELRLYYSATAGGAHEFAELSTGASAAPAESEYIGVAHHTGSGFRQAATPVLEGRCPAVIEWDGILHLFYVKVARGGYRIHLATSADGASFADVQPQPVVDVGPAGRWDSYTVTTPKVFRDDDHFTMLYAGDASSIDDPTGVGIAVSEDLVHWEKHAGNPVFCPGKPGEFDSVSVASTVPVRCAAGWQILYAGSDQTIADGLHSQVGRAWLGA